MISIWKILGYTKSVSVPTIEGYLRWRDRLALASLRVRGQSTVVETRNLDEIVEDRVVIFAAHPHEDVKPFHARFLERFARRGYKVIVVCHHPRAADMLAPFAERGWGTVRRLPFGRDFGAYSDATRELYRIGDRMGKTFSRVVYVNDSVVTMAPAEEQIVSHLDSTVSNFSGLTENYDKGFHISSYMFSVSDKVLYAPKVRKYWTRYQPLSTRRYAIARGEIGFSRLVMRCGFLPDIKWSIGRLKYLLEQMDLDRLSMIAEAMERHFVVTTKHPVIQMNDYVASFGRGVRQADSNITSPDGMVRLVEGAIAYARRKKGSGRKASSDSLDLSDLQEMTVDDQKAIANRVARDRMLDSIINHVFRGSQVHHGAAPLLFAGAGIMKKDLMLRRIVEPQNVLKLLRDSGCCEASDFDLVADELVARGHPKSFRGRRALMLKWGFI